MRTGGAWLRRAAEGVPDAQFMYGRMLAEGRGVAPDLREARASGWRALPTPMCWTPRSRLPR